MQLSKTDSIWVLSDSYIYSQSNEEKWVYFMCWQTTFHTMIHDVGKQWASYFACLTALFTRVNNFHKDSSLTTIRNSTTPTS